MSTATVEYDTSQLLKTSAIIAGVLLPLLIGLACIGAYIYRRSIKEEKPDKVWQYQANGRSPSLSSLISTRRRSQLNLATPAASVSANDPLLSDAQRRPVEEGTQRAGRPSASLRPFDGVYNTNEPLPNRPEVDFEDKVWGLEDEGEHSVYTDSSFSSPSTSGVVPPKKSVPNAGSSSTPTAAQSKQRLSSVETDIF